MIEIGHTYFHSNFWDYSKYERVAICNSVPDDFNGPRYGKLAPLWGLVDNYKKGKITKDEFIECYKRDTLSHLSPDLVIQELVEEYGDKILLTCWEGRNKFCHRYIVMDWLKKANLEGVKFIN